MKTIALGSLAVALVASAGMADIVPSDVDRTGYQMYTATAQEIGDAVAARGFPAMYDNIAAGPGGYLAFPAAEGVLGVSDYVSAATGNQALEQFRFVGGVTTASTVIFVDFFDAGANHVSGFGVTLPSAGNFIWTITLGGAFTAADTGLVQIVTDAGTAGQWFLSDGAAAVGSTGAADVDNNGQALDHNYAMTVPAPGAMALLGLGGLVAGRRRR